MATISPEDAVEAVLAEMSAVSIDDTAIAVPAHSDPESVLTDTVPAAAPQCTEEQARALVATARQSITALHDAMTDIIRGRAWLALGYDSPERFWVTEFRGDEASGGLGYSRSYLYRTAQMLAVLYGLHERIGDTAFALEIPERAIRELSKGRGDLDVVMDTIASKVRELPADADPRELQRIADKVITEAREAKTPSLPETSRDELEAGLALYGLGAMTPDVDPFTAESSEGDGWRDDYQQRQGLSLGDISDSIDVDPEHLKLTQLVTNLTRSMQMLSEISEAPTSAVLEHMNPAEVANLTSGATTIISVLEEMIVFAESDDAPLDTSDLW